MDVKDQLKLGVLVGSLRKRSFSRALGQCLGELAPQATSVVELPPIGLLPLFNQDVLDETGVPQPLQQLADAIGPEVQISQIRAKMSADLSEITDPATTAFITQRLAAFSVFAQREHLHPGC